jgi:2-oxo-4-hydroxy-4-carboxy-5-ureidoimidazoline decarboxylase
LKTTSQLDAARQGKPARGTCLLGPADETDASASATPGSPLKRYGLKVLNGLSQVHFVRVVGPVFEDSSWIAEQTWAHRPFETGGALHRALCNTVLAADQASKLALIRAHPDLAGKAAKTGRLTAASTREQASGGLDTLAPEEAARFDQYNRAYREKFGFPFVICVRQNRKEAVLAGFERRLPNSPEQEIETALAEIFKIAELRLDDLIAS